MRVVGQHWALAFSGALMVHAGIAAAILWQPPESGTRSAGMGGVEVSLGPAGGSPDGEARPVEEVPEAKVVDAIETAATIAPTEAVTVKPPEPARPKDVRPVEAETAMPTEMPIEAVPVQDAASIEVTETAPVAEPVELAERQPPIKETRTQQPVPPAKTALPEEVVAMAEVAPPPPKPNPRPPELPQQQTRPESAPQIAPEPQTAELVEPPEEQTAVVTPSAASGKAGTQANPKAGSADASSGGGLPSLTADYMTALRAWLEKHKEYPEEARRRHQEGAALLRFTLTQNGEILDIVLKKRTGYRLLDAAAILMAQKAAPFPPIPQELGRSSLSIIVPVHFALE